MPQDKKNRDKKQGQQGIEPETYNDQLGENASEEYRSEHYSNSTKNKKK